MTTTESLWDPDQQALMLALWQYEATLCPGCGQPLEESTSPDNDRDNRAGTGYYHVGPPTRCHACTALHTARKAHRADGGDPTALMWRPELRERG